MSQFIFLPSGGVPILPPAIYQPSEQLCPVMDILVQPTTSMDVYAFATTAWAVNVFLFKFTNQMLILSNFTRYLQERNLFLIFQISARLNASLWK
jgi:hypothetical protein